MEHLWNYPLNRQPLTEDQMKMEIASSRIRSPDSEELSPEAVSKTLESLNLSGDKYATRIAE